MNKAELTTEQIVILIILITSFAIILIFLFNLDLGKTTDAQICHNSVVMASKNKLGGKLNCKIKYTCIASKKGDCNNFNYNKKIEIKSDLENIEEVKKEISSAIANEMSECWWMFGEGNLEYIGDLFGFHCAICNEIEFGDKIQKKVHLNYGDFLIQLTRLKKDESQTFFRYLYEDSNPNEFINQNEYFSENFDKPIELNKKYLIITGMNKELIDSNKIIKPLFIKSEDISKSKCEAFDLTKP